MHCRVHPGEACPLAATICQHKQGPQTGADEHHGHIHVEKHVQRDPLQASPWGAVAPGCCSVHKQQPHQAPHTGADEQHGDEQAAGDGAPCCPDCPQEVERQHHDEGAIVELPVGAAAEQVLDRILACKSVNGSWGTRGFSDCSHSQADSSLQLTLLHVLCALLLVSCITQPVQPGSSLRLHRLLPADFNAISNCSSLECLSAIASAMAPLQAGGPPPQHIWLACGSHRCGQLTADPAHHWPQQTAAPATHR